jgi:hypothetical protein
VRKHRKYLPGNVKRRIHMEEEENIKTNPKEIHV